MVKTKEEKYRGGEGDEGGRGGGRVEEEREERVNRKIFKLNLNLLSKSHLSRLALMVIYRWPALINLQSYSFM